MEMEAMIQEYLEYGTSRQLRKKTLHSYEQALRMFSIWLDASGMHDVEQIREVTVRKYMLSLQTRGKYEKPACPYSVCSWCFVSKSQKPARNC